ncbi:hypothetical protein ABZX40_39635 [Streptomyces sp. NPDC004610]|uniref:hypothetical protein n=1 Tax=unclassified Streptomyces TaxID=2593676 RepID=UPI0033A5D874
MASRPPADENPPTTKMTIEVCTVDRHGTIVKPPRTTVVVPVDHDPPSGLLGTGTRFPPCACPLHRRPGVMG